MPPRKPRYFLLIYYDDDAKIFSVVGPISDDQAVTARTVELQNMGKHVRISTPKPEVDLNKVPSIEKYMRGKPVGYRHDPNLKW
jgi:hypothetical protein